MSKSTKRDAERAWQDLLREFNPALTTPRNLFMAAFALGVISALSREEVKP